MTEPVFIGHRGYHDKIYGYFPMSQKTNFVNIARHLGFKVCYSGVRNEYDGHCTIIAPTDIYLNEIPGYRNKCLREDHMILRHSQNTPDVLFITFPTSSVVHGFTEENLSKFIGCAVVRGIKVTKSQFHNSFYS